MAGIKIVRHGDRRWYPVGSAALRLSTSTAKVKALMGDGTLEWCQKGNSRTLLVSLDDVETFRNASGDALREKSLIRSRSPDALRRRPSDLPKLGENDGANAGRSDVFLKTWDPTTGR